MKNIYKLLTFIVLIASFTSCEEDLIIYDNAGFIQIDDASAVTIVENSGDAVEILAILGSAQSSDTTVDFLVTGDDSRYALSASSIVIPAGETSGAVTLSAIDDDEINGDIDVVIGLAGSSGLPIGLGGEGLNSVSKTITIVDDNVPCNDVFVSVTTDRWGSENSWEIRDASGALVDSDGPFADLPAGATETYEKTVNLEDGCYVFTMFDSYGDGMGTGTYVVTCGAIVHAQGGGDLADGNQSESTDFCVNQ